MFDLQVETPIKSIPPEHVVWRKNDGDTPKNVFSRAAQEIAKKNNKKHLTWYFTPMPGGPCWADCCNFLHVGWHPRRNHAYQILSRSLRELRSYGGPKSGFSYSFLNGSYNSFTHYRATLWLDKVKLMPQITWLDDMLAAVHIGCFSSWL